MSSSTQTFYLEAAPTAVLAACRAVAAKQGLTVHESGAESMVIRLQFPMRFGAKGDVRCRINAQREGQRTRLELAGKSKGLLQGKLVDDSLRTFHNSVRVELGE
jgi:hypothetical protein